MSSGMARAAGLPFTWAMVWAMPGFGIELLSNLGVQLSFTSNVDMWPQTLGLPGLVAGVLFAMVVAATGRWRTFETSSLGLLLGLGLVVGLVMCGIVATGVVGGEASPATYGFVLVMSVVSAGVTALLFRSLRRHRLQRA